MHKNVSHKGHLLVISEVIPMHKRDQNRERKVICPGFSKLGIQIKATMHADSCLTFHSSFFLSQNVATKSRH